MVPLLPSVIEALPIERLAADREFARQLGRNGFDYVNTKYDRDVLARDYFHIIRNAIESCPIVV